MVTVRYGRPHLFAKPTGAPTGVVVMCGGRRLRRENTVLPYGSENNVKLALFETGLSH